MFYTATVGINGADLRQAIDGFGAANASWKSVTGYTNAAFYDLIVNDLGASAARTAIWPTFEEGNDNADPNTFDWADYDPAALGYSMTFMKRLQDRGMKNLMATVWTPPTFLRTNQTYYYGGAIRPDMRDEFAEYLAAVAISAKRDFGVDLSHMSLQNEPFFVQEYESATYSAEQMREAIRAVMRKFDKEGLGTQLVVPEELAKKDRFQWYVDAIMGDPETAAFPGVFAVHGAGSPNWPDIGNIMKADGGDHKLWSTEYHGHEQNITGALQMANDIFNAITVAGASAYLYWQWSETPGESKHSLMVDGQPAIKYHVAKHFYRYVRPGANLIGATTTDGRAKVASFKHPQSGAVTHVLANRETTAAELTINLSGSNLPTSYKVYRTTGTENHVQLANVTGGTQIKITLPPESIVTLYSGADLAPVQATSGGSLPSRQTLHDPVLDDRLNEAAVKGDLGDIREFLAQGDNVNATIYGGYSALHAAAAGPYETATAAINELLGKGANVAQKTNEGFTPLHFASMNVWTRGATTTGPLAGDKIRALITGGSDPNTKDNAGRTALHWAAMMPKIAHNDTPFYEADAIDALLDGGASVNATDNKGWTPLDYAVREGITANADELKARGGVHGAGAPTDNTSPTSDVVDVSPDPRSTAVTSIDVTFSEPVTGVDLADFALTRDGGAISLSGATITQLNSTTWRIGNLTPLTGVAGAYMLRLEKAGSGIFDTAGNALATSASDSWTFAAAAPQTPFKGSPFAFSNSAGVTIQAEDYDLGGQGVAYNDITANNTGNQYRTSEGVDIKLISGTTNQYRFSDVGAGEWVEYTILANQAGDYELEFRLSNTGANGKLHAEIDGVNVTGNIDAPNTGSFNTFASVKRTVAIGAGTHVLRLAFDQVATSLSAAGVDWLKITPVSQQPPPPVGATVVSSIVSYVRDGEYANTNYGPSSEMSVKQGFGTGSTREGYVRFDLTNVSAIGTAKLRLNGKLSESSASGVKVNVFNSSNTTWGENSITWNTKPAALATVHASFTVTGTSAAWYEVDVTQFLKDEFAAGRKVVTFVLKGDIATSPRVAFATDSSSTNAPRLVIS